jgi:SAM-dependent methyltransferase
MSDETTTHATTPQTDAETSERLKRVWARGNYSPIGTSLQLTGELLCESLDVGAGDRVLDIAAGNGNAALAAARRGATVTASDYVRRLLDDAAARAAADGLALECTQADAESLPFADGAFDVVLSTFGVMFTTDHERALAELLRVTAVGGRIGLTAWTPDGFIGRVLRTVRASAVQPAGVPSPLVWGDAAALTRLFGGRAALNVTPREHVFRYRSAQEWLDFFRTYYGPMNSAFARPDVDVAVLEAGLLNLAEESNTSISGRWRVPSGYLEVVALPQ